MPMIDMCMNNHPSHRCNGVLPCITYLLSNKGRMRMHDKAVHQIVRSDMHRMDILPTTDAWGSRGGMDGLCLSNARQGQLSQLRQCQANGGVNETRGAGRG